jgi:hypothetical protein
MKISHFLFSLILLNSAVSQSQTRLIAHKSHSGSNKTFARALENTKSSILFSNFGMAPQRFVRNSNLDSVILLSNNTAIMVTSETCNWEEFDGRDKSGKQLWSAGRDTVYDHPVFTSKNSLSEIKSTLKDEYFFSNPINSIVFIGFDSDFQKEISTLRPSKTPDLATKSNTETVSETTTKKRPKSLFLIFILSIFNAIFNHKF